MSDGPHTHNPIEHDESPIEDETRFKCACGDPSCYGFSDDPGNFRLGKSWYAADCPMAHRLNLIADGRESASRADVRRDDETFTRR
jgi:hypothetical protein